MKVKEFTVNPFQMNCYLYYDEISLEGILIDPGFYGEDEKDFALDFISRANISIKYIVNTHGHIDHILGNGFAKETFCAPLYIHKEDELLVSGAKEQAAMFGFHTDTPPAFDGYINEDSSLFLGKTEINFIHTPGHSPGGVCIIDHIHKNVFCGDLIFKGSVGRTDLPGGNHNTLIKSIKEKLFRTCADDYTLFPGHMEKTTVGEEKKHNPFLA